MRATILIKASLLTKAQLNYCLCNRNAISLYINKRGVVQQKNSQGQIFNAPHFRLVVNICLFSPT